MKKLFLLLFVFLLLTAPAYETRAQGSPPPNPADDPCAQPFPLPSCPDPTLPPTNNTPPANTPAKTCSNGQPMPTNGVCPPSNTSNSGPPVIGCDTTYNTTKNGLCLPKNPLGDNLTGIAGTGNITELAAKLINLLLYFAGIVAVIFVIIGGYRYMAAGGSEEDAGKGRKTMTNAIVGLIIVILAYVIINAITNFLIK